MNDSQKHSYHMYEISTTPQLVNNDIEYTINSYHTEGDVHCLHITKFDHNTCEKQILSVRITHPYANVSSFVPAKTVDILKDTQFVPYVNGYGDAVFSTNKNSAIIGDTVALHFEPLFDSIVWLVAQPGDEEKQPTSESIVLNLDNLIHTSLYAKARTVDYVHRKVCEELGEISKAINQPERCDEPPKCEIADLIIASLDLLIVHELENDPSLTVSDIIGDFQEIMDAKVTKWAKQQEISK